MGVLKLVLRRAVVPGYGTLRTLICAIIEFTRKWKFTASLWLA